MTFDELVAANPHLGFCVYRVEPSDPTTLEVIDGEETFTFTGATLQAAIDKAFPVAPAPPELVLDVEGFLGRAPSVFD